MYNLMSLHERICTRCCRNIMTIGFVWKVSRLSNIRWILKNKEFIRQGRKARAFYQDVSTHLMPWKCAESLVLGDVYNG